MYMYLYMNMYTSSFLMATSAKESILGTCSRKNEHGHLGIKVKTTTFLKMAPQAKPLCSLVEPRSPFSEISHHGPKTIGQTPKIVSWPECRPEFQDDDSYQKTETLL